ncbi:CBS domain-containing protein [Allohahella marinimesophila]|uniref:CBS domain-containing protein n=1 Tax=Allohahella marinimesophila TaxID=1054972 RepID=A0ABP7P9T0_9GAMM
MVTMQEMMSTPVRTLSPDDSVLDARRAMAEWRVRHIPILSVHEIPEKRRLVGIVSRGDLLAAMDSDIYAMTEDERAEHEASISLERIMTKNVATASPETGMADGANFLLNRKVGCLPIVREKQVIGIVTDHDFVRATLKLLERLETESPVEND